LVNKIYLKAVAFSIVFALAVFFIINQLDAASIGRLESKITDSQLSVQESNLFFEILSEASDKEKVCEIIQQKIDSQSMKNAGLIDAIDQAEKSIFIVDFTGLKKSYFLSNAELFFLIKKSNEVCNENNQTILYFYRDAKPLCSDCIVQGKILDEIRAKCGNVKTFAFPIDLDLGFVELFKTLYGIDTVPSMVINEKNVFNGLASEQEIMPKIQCGT